VAEVLEVLLLVEEYVSSVANFKMFFNMTKSPVKV
jgi:hypothetical protein